MNYDVIIVGAGPAGSTAARYLASKGWTVLILEKDVYPGEKNVCGGALSKRVINNFHVPTKVIERKVKNLTLVSPFNTQIMDSREGGFGVATDRKIFDRVLAELAVDKGAIIQTDSICTSVKIGSDSVEAIYKKNGHEKRVTGRVIIGADGVNSLVAKQTGLRNNLTSYNVAIGVEYEIRPKNFDLCNDFEIYLGSNIAPAGYGWIIKKSDYITVGIGSILSRVKNPKLLLEYLVKEHPLVSKKIDGKILEHKAALLPYGLFGGKIFSDRILLAGDAAGFTSPLTGEGIYYAMSSGELAADTINQALGENNLSKQSLKSYQQQTDHLWANDFLWGVRLRKFLFENEKFADVIIKTAQKSENVKKIIASTITGELTHRETFFKMLPYLPYAYLKSKLG